MASPWLRTAESGFENISEACSTCLKTCSRWGVAATSWGIQSTMLALLQLLPAQYDSRACSIAVALLALAAVRWASSGVKGNGGQSMENDSLTGRTGLSSASSRKQARRCSALLCSGCCCSSSFSAMTARARPGKSQLMLAWWLQYIWVTRLLLLYSTRC